MSITANIFKNTKTKFYPKLHVKAYKVYKVNHQSNRTCDQK